MNRKGTIVSFSGVDGAGKTTVLRLLKESLELSGHKVVELRCRPSVLPILSSIVLGKEKAERRSINNLPRTGGNNSTISSFIRFLYYLADYFFGSIVIYFRYTYKGYYILYDRHFYDLIVDPRRYNLSFKSDWTKFFLKFINQPNINIFLYASPEKILSRKEELSKEDILELTQSYIELFDSLSKKYNNIYCCIENNEIQDTISSIEDLIEK